MTYVYEFADSNMYIYMCLTYIGISYMCTHTYIYICISVVTNYISQTSIILDSRTCSHESVLETKKKDPKYMSLNQNQCF